MNYTLVVMGRKMPLGLPILAALIFPILTTITFNLLLNGDFKQNESSDFSSFYEPVARNFLHGQGISIEGQVATRYPPGYPIILAAVFGVSEFIGIEENLALAFLVLTCVSLSTVSLYFLAARFFGILGSLIVVFLWSFNPFLLWLTKQPNSELPFMVLFFAGLACFWKFILEDHNPFKFVLAGILIGAAALVRPIALAVAPIMAVFLLIYRPFTLKKRVKLSLATILGSLILILPWEAWVYAQTHHVILLSSGGLPSLWDGMTFAIDENPIEGLSANIYKLMQDLESQYPESYGDAVSTLLVIATKNPYGMGELIGMKALRSWYGTETGRLEWIGILAQLAYMVFIVPGIVLMLRAQDEKRWYAILVLCLVLNFWAMTIAALSIVRYMTPAIGLLITLSPAWLVRTNWFRQLSNKAHIQ